MKIGIISFTRNGERLNEEINSGLKNLGHKVYSYTTKEFLGFRNLEIISLRDFTRNMFKKDNGLIFIGATGIAIRSIAPYIRDKINDPCIISLDERGENVISLLSGHIGGGNRLCRQVASIIGARAIISTATDINGKLSVDEFAKINNLHIEDINIAKEISSNIVDNNRVCLLSDFPIESSIPRDIILKPNGNLGIVISLNVKKPYKKTLNLIPKIVSIGIGCRRGISMDKIEEFILGTLNEKNISILGVKNICTINLKSEEKGLIEFAKKYNIDFKTFTPEELNKALGEFTPSEFVRGVTGVDNVCERAASLGSNGEIILKKISKDGITLSISIERWGVNFEY